MQTLTTTWTAWTGIRTDNEGWIWTEAGNRKHSTDVKALARKLARQHQIKSDFGDGRAVAYTFNGWEPTNTTMVCNRFGSFMELREVWP